LPITATLREKTQGIGMNEQPTTSRPLRPRFSLFTALLVMALVACGITIWQLWREVGPLRAENRRLRSEVGFINIDDPDKLHALLVPRGRANEWRWRLYVPDRGKFGLFVATEEIPVEGVIPKDGIGGPILLPYGEYFIDAELRQDPNRPERWRVYLRYGTGGATFGMSQRDRQWLPNPETGSNTFKASFMKDGQNLLTRGEPLVLFRLRAQDVQPIDDAAPTRNRAGQVVGQGRGRLRTRSVDILEPCEGFLMWIEAIDSK
jgi:hypothetical protein